MTAFVESISFFIYKFYSFLGDINGKIFRVKRLSSRK